MSEEEDNGDHFKIHGSLGSLSLTVEGGDEEWVKETFDEEWEERMEESAEISKALRDGARSHQ